MRMTDAPVSERALPAGFERVEKLVIEWALPSEHERRERRATSSMTSLREFYELVGPLIADMARHLDKFPIGRSLPPLELRLLQLAQMYMEVAWAVEVLDNPEEQGQVPRERWKITPVKGAIVNCSESIAEPLQKGL
jgi:hypothetical protein